MPSASEFCRILCYRNSKQGATVEAGKLGKGIMVLLCLEGWWDLRIQRGEGQAFGWEQHEQNSRAQIYHGCLEDRKWKVPVGRFQSHA